MSAHHAIDIIKEAILLERRGKAFYQQVADQARDQDVQSFFEMMANEERHHIEILEKQFKSYQAHQAFSDLDTLKTEDLSKPHEVLSTDIQKKIAAADFEAAAVSAAVLLEERAVALYSKRAESTQDPKEKALYEWLARWEQGHLSFLAKLDKEIKEEIWHSQDFWPF